MARTLVFWIFLLAATEAHGQVEARPVGKKTSPAPQQVQLQFQVLEVSRTKDAEAIRNGAGAAEVVDKLRQRGAVRVLAEPTIVTLSGRRALLKTGGELPMPGGTPLEFGTRVDCLPKVLSNGKIGLDVMLDVSELDASHGLQRYMIRTSLEVKPGETIVLGGVVQKTENAGAEPLRKETLVVLTAEIVTPALIGSPPDPSPAR